MSDHDHDHDHDDDHDEHDEHDEELTGRDRRTHVVAKTWVTPSMVRITVAGDLDDFGDQGTDQHVALLFHTPAPILPARLDRRSMAELHRFVHPRMRRYTVRRWDPVRQEVEFDFYVHEPAGVASRWARDARVGDELVWWGPTDAWRLRPTTTDLLLVGDETALPGIDAILASLPVRGGPRVAVAVEVADPAEQTYLREHAGVPVTWVARAANEPEDREVDADDVASGLVRALDEITIDLTPGTCQVWAAAEFSTVAALRRRLLGETGLGKDDAFLVTYWTRGRAQDARPDARGAARAAAQRRAHPDLARRFVRDQEA